MLRPSALPSEPCDRVVPHVAARSSCSSTPGTFRPHPLAGRRRRRWRAAAASTGAPSAPGRRTAPSRAARWAPRRRDDRPHDRARRQARRRRSSASRTRAARACRRASARCTPTAAIFRAQALADGAADQRDRRPVRGRRGVLARARRPHGHGRPRREDVPHRPGRGRARSRASGSRALELGGPKVHGAQRRRAPLRRATTCTPPSSSARRSRTCPRRRAARCRCYPPADPAPGDPGEVAARARARGLRRARRRRAAGRRRRAARVRAALGAQPGRRLRPHRRARRSASSPTSPQHLGGCLDAESSQKGAWFVDLCDRFGLPLVVLVDTPGFLPGVSQEQAGRHPPRRLAAAGLRDGHRRRASRSRCAQAYGGAHIVMNSRDLGADLTLAWPHAKIGVMGAASGRRDRQPPRDRGRCRRRRAGRRVRRRAPAGAGRRRRAATSTRSSRRAETRERIAFALEAAR